LKSTINIISDCFDLHAIQKDTIDSVNFYDFAHWFIIKADKLAVRPKVAKGFYENLRFYPNPPPFGRNKNYALHCMFQLILYKPWHNNPDTMIEYLLKDTEEDEAKEENSEYDENKRRLECFQHAYKDFLEFEQQRAKKSLSPVLYANALKQASFAHGIWSKKDAAQYEEQQKSQCSRDPEEWMCLLHASNILKVSKKYRFVEKDDWDISPIATTMDIKRHLTQSVMTNKQTFIVPPFKDSTDDIKFGTPEQILAYKIIMNHQQRALQDRNTEPLHMLIQGEAGTGKSWLFPILRRDLIKNTKKFCAQSARAAILIGGVTIHSLMTIPIGRAKKIIDGIAKNKLQDRFKSKVALAATYIIIDERSLIGSHLFYWMNKRLQDATGKSDIFGGISVIMFGDIMQLPPVQDSVLYECRPDQRGKAEVTDAFNLHLQFETVVILSEIKRQSGKSKKAQQFRDALGRLRLAETIPEDYDFFKQRFLTNLSVEEERSFDDVMHIMYKRDFAASHNADCLHKLEMPIAQINADHHPLDGHGHEASVKLAGNLAPTIKVQKLC